MNAHRERRAPARADLGKEQLMCQLRQLVGAYGCLWPRSTLQSVGQAKKRVLSVALRSDLPSAISKSLMAR
jgi:hypothetical protein